MKDMIADVLTKPFANVRHQALTKAMGLQPLTICRVKVLKIEHSIALSQ